MTISNCLVQDSVAVHLFVRKLLDFLTAKIIVEKVYYFSDGAASQYKNRHFVNLAFHTEDFKLPAEWQFFAPAQEKNLMMDWENSEARCSKSKSAKTPGGPHRNTYAAL